MRWILAHKKTFLIAPVTILFTGLTIWLGIGKTLAPVGWAINRFAREQASPELKHAMYLQTTEAVTRPLVELDQLRWQRVKRRRRLDLTSVSLWRRPDPGERDAEVAHGHSVLQERRILPGIGREFMPPLDEGSFLYMPSLLPQAGLGPAHRSQRPAGHGHRQRAGGGVASSASWAAPSPRSIPRPSA